MAHPALHETDFQAVPEHLASMGKLVDLNIDFNQNEVDIENLQVDGMDHKKLQRRFRHHSESDKYVLQMEQKHKETKCAKKGERSTECSSENYCECGGRPKENCEEEIVENWDVSDNSADEYDPTCENEEATRKPSTKFSYLTAISRSRLFCPANRHPLPIRQQIFELVEKGILRAETKIQHDEGQFEDA